MEETLHQNDTERLHQLAQHLLLNTGTPTNWGSLRDRVPTSLGLADSTALLPYQLDIDKITRLNNLNTFSLTYSQLWQSLGVGDVSFRVEIKTLFNITATLTLTTVGVNETTYEFDLYAHKSGTPVSASLRSYVVVGDYVDSVASSTAANGHSSVSVAIPNSMNGTALLVTFAKAESDQQIVAFDVSAFSHNSPEPLPNRTFTQLSPLNHALNVNFTYPSAEVRKALVFTHNFNFTLTEKSHSAQTAEYDIPRLLDSSAIILVLTGFNGSFSFAEWVSYPQLPLTVGADFDSADTGAKTVAFSEIVAINSALYEVVTKWRLVSDV